MQQSNDAAKKKEKEKSEKKNIFSQEKLSPCQMMMLSTMTTISLLTVAGLADHVAAAKLRIKEVCALKDTQLKWTMVEFQLFTDDLDHC